MKPAELRTKKPAELDVMMEDIKAQLANAHVELKTKEVKNVREIRKFKRTIARIMTIQSERELAELEQTNG
ncbi:MAG: 50S ribosomal protein L29 [bacterium]